MLEALFLWASLIFSKSCSLTLHLLLCHQYNELNAQHFYVFINIKSHWQKTYLATRHKAYLFLCSLLLCRDHVVAFVFLHCAQHTNAHLVGATEELQAFLMLRTDLPVQVTNFIDQLVPLEGGRLIVGLEMLLAIGGQTHEAGFDGFVLLANADVAADILRSRMVVIGGRWWRRKWLAVALEGGMAWTSSFTSSSTYTSTYASWCGPFAVSDPALWAEVRARVVGMVPIGLQANWAKDVATRDRHRIPEVLLAQVAGLLIGWHGDDLEAGSCGLQWQQCAASVCQESGKVSPQVVEAEVI